MKKPILIIALLLVLSLTLISCADDSSQEDTNGVETEVEIDEDEPGESGDVETNGDANAEGNDGAVSMPQYNNLLAQAIDLIEMIDAKDYESLALQVHPEKGLRFSPDVEVKPNIDLVFTADQVAGLWDDTTERTWGYYWGAGLWIHFPFADYHGQFLSSGYNNPDIIGINNVIGVGSLANNISTESSGSPF